MMPHTDASGVAVVRQRLAHNVERLASEHIGRLQLRQASFTAPDDLLEQEDAALLLARLGGELG